MLCARGYVTGSGEEGSGVEGVGGSFLCAYRFSLISCTRSWLTASFIHVEDVAQRFALLVFVFSLSSFASFALVIHLTQTRVHPPQHRCIGFGD